MTNLQCGERTGRSATWLNLSAERGDVLDIHAPSDMHIESVSADDSPAGPSSIRGVTAAGYEFPIIFALLSRWYTDDTALSGG